MMVGKDGNCDASKKRNTAKTSDSFIGAILRK